MSTILDPRTPRSLYSLWRGRQVEWVKGPKPRKKSWSELSEIFVEIEKKEHEAELAKMTALKERPTPNP